MQSTLISTFPERLRAILDETGIRQTDLCDKAGIGKSAMSQYLHGAFIPKQAKLSAIAEALDVSEGWLMGYDVPRHRITMSSSSIGDGTEMVHESLVITASDNSMQSAYIPKDAKVVLRTVGDELPQGEIVCAVINDSKPQLRFLHVDGDRIMLTASDPGFAPQVFDVKDLENSSLRIYGVVERVIIEMPKVINK